MNQCTLILSVSFLFGLSHSAYTQVFSCTNDGDEHKPKGKIKSFTEKCYWPFKGNYSLSNENSYYYDEEDNLTKQIYGFGQGLRTDNYFYTDGKLMKLDLDLGLQSNVHNIKIFFCYDNDGKKISEIEFKDDLPSVTTKFKYDDLGNQIEQDYIETKNGKLLDLIKFNYNRHGNMIYEERRVLSSNKIYKYFYKYDTDENLIEKIVNQNNINIDTSAYKYDEKRNKIERICYLPGYLAKVTYTYDNSNNITGEYSYNSDGTLVYKILYQIEYDMRENWISISQFDLRYNEMPIITKREIEYSADQTVIVDY